MSRTGRMTLSRAGRASALSLLLAAGLMMSLPASAFDDGEENGGDGQSAHPLSSPPPVLVPPPMPQSSSPAPTLMTPTPAVSSPVQPTPVPILTPPSSAPAPVLTPPASTMPAGLTQPNAAATSPSSTAPAAVSSPLPALGPLPALDGVAPQGTTPADASNTGAPASILPSLGGAPTPTAPTALPRQPDQVFDTAIMQGMDKVTGRVMTIEAPVGITVRYGTLEFIVRTCRKRPPEESPEAAAFVDIWEVRNNQPAESQFRGWMFASSPALSALEHPVYDIWAVDCLDSKSKTSAPPKSP